MKATSRDLGVTVHVLASAALLEALGLHWAPHLERSRRKAISVYSPVDLRRVADGRLDSAMGQMLGAVTAQATVVDGKAFRDLAIEVKNQFLAARVAAHHYGHSSHMALMAKLWDWLPRSAYAVAGPFLLPQAGFVSNVDVSEFLAEELNAKSVRDYFRFSGTGIVTPMMLGMTTLGKTYHLTSTHHTDVFESADVRRILSHVQWRLDGNVAEPVSLARFESCPRGWTESVPLAPIGFEISHAREKTVAL